jgi:hypothetical protein
LSADYKAVSIFYHIYCSVLYIVPYFAIDFVKKDKVPGFINMIFYATQINGICLIVIPVYIGFVGIIVHI